MNFLDWLEVASLAARLIGLAISPVVLFFSVSGWIKGNKESAIYLMLIYAILSIPR